MADLELNQSETAKRAGLGVSFVRDILRGKSGSPNSANIGKLALALETTPDWLIVGGTAPQTNESVKPVEIGGLHVVGKIQAGAWLDRTLIDEEEDKEVIPVALDPRFPRARQYGLQIIGDSMDIDYPDGSYVSCVDYYDSGIAIKDGLIVHVERHSGSLVEVTLKAIETIAGRRMLVPRSTNPRHAPIPLEGDGGTEIMVRGIVTGSYRRTFI